jgi:hypothetical protein
MICRLAFALCLVLACVPSVWAGTYSTIFPATENPISESGHWVNGGTVGLDWANVRTTPGLAFGTQSGASGRYDDSTALLSGTWGPDHTAEVTVRIVTPSAVGQREVELRLRSTVTAHTNSGYEVLCNVNTNPNYGIQIVRWFGPLGSYDYINTSPALNCVNGDVLKATIAGNPPTITVWRNGVQVLQGTDRFANPPTTGSPGIGFWNNGATNSEFGLSYFSATDGGGSGSAVPSAPYGLVVQ